MQQAAFFFDSSFMQDLFDHVLRQPHGGAGLELRRTDVDPRVIRPLDLSLVYHSQLIWFSFPVLPGDLCFEFRDRGAFNLAIKRIEELKAAMSVI